MSNAREGESTMTSSRPYLIRAIYEWLIDNTLTPYLLVDASDDSVQVPRQYIQDGRIVLNITPGAVVSLELGNEYISFSARFGGVAQEIFVPVHRVLAIYARENGQGMMFGDEDETPPPSGGGGEPREKGKTGPAKRPSLKVVK